MKDNMQRAGTSLTSKQWEKAFSHASLWTDVANKFGIGFLIYLPVQDHLFANNDSDLLMRLMLGDLKRWMIVHFGNVSGLITC